MTAFGIHSRLSSKAARRILEAGRQFQIGKDGAAKARPFINQPDRVDQGLPVDFGSSDPYPKSAKTKAKAWPTEHRIGEFPTSNGSPVSRVRALEIASTIGVSHGLTLQDVLDHDRTRRVALARAQIMYVLHVEQGISQEMVGELLQRDNSTVASAVQRYAKRMNLPFEKKSNRANK